jgi:murein DD-endopeptidase MepM/ murein hydrolase activator NlpD
MEPNSTEQKDSPSHTSFFARLTKTSRFRKIAKGLIGLTVVAGIGYAAFEFPLQTSEQTQEAGLLSVPDPGAFPVINPTIKWGFVMDTFQVKEDEIRKNTTLSALLAQLGLKGGNLDILNTEARGLIENKDFRSGNEYTVLKDQHTGDAKHLIIQPNDYYYFVFNLADPVSVQRIDRTVVKQYREVAGTVVGTLWESMDLYKLPYEIIDLMEDALKYNVDFTRIVDGDEFKLIFEEEFVEGKSVGASKLQGAYFYSSRKKEATYSFFYEGDGVKGYFTEDGKPWKSGFLKSPVKYSRISSRYNLKRLHPVLGYVKPHFGTDFAAAHGTPIMTVADGVIMEAQRKGGNGNYVKVKHNGTYQTQYLHMSRFAKGIRPGTRVRQGEIIGYVGSTGLATGPHVCFRLWKNGKQIDPLKEKLPAFDVMNAQQASEYRTITKLLKEKMEALPVSTGAPVMAAPAS